MSRYGRDFSPYTRGLHMGPMWGNRNDPDPNWRGGEYQGQRERGDDRHAAYGRYRHEHQYDLGEYGGYDGRYDTARGRFGSDGIWRDGFGGEVRRMHQPGHQGRGGYDRQYGGGRGGYDRQAGYGSRGGYDRGFRRVEGGGVQDDNRYLRQYNARSPELRGGYDRGWGYAEGPDAPPMLGRDGRERPTREREYAGYNRGGFSEGKYEDPGIRR